MNRPRRKPWAWLPKMFIHRAGDILFIEGDAEEYVCSASLPLREISRMVDAHRNNRGLMTAEGITAAAICLKQTSGVYFLIADGEIVYVGKSTNVESRLVNHSFTKAGQFDSYFVIEAPEKFLRDLECRYITALRPKLNCIYNN